MAEFNADGARQKMGLAKRPISPTSVILPVDCFTACCYDGDNDVVIALIRPAGPLVGLAGLEFPK